MSESPPDDPHARWKFLRDVLVFQLKLILGNLQNFLLVPVSLVAAFIDVFVKHERHGGRFYRVLEWGRKTDEAIDIYSAIGGYNSTAPEEGGAAMKSDFTVDSVLARVEGVIVREYRKGGTAASVKSAVDKALDQLQHETGKGKAKADDVVKRLAGKLRDAKDEPPP
jgi:hypothetical protein